MKAFVAIIGGRNSGKSTVITSITGCKSRSFEGVVRDRTTNKGIMVIASSPQESLLSRRNFNDIISQTVEDESIGGLLMAIQPSNPRVKMSMEEIFKTVRETSRFKSYSIIIDPAYENASLEDSSMDVRSRLKRIGEKSVKVVDGRRFAHLNAIEVAKFTKLLA
jgi:ABC-type dipeptide/oligopeptide/nickel transport system ATPase subunit